MSGLKLFQNKKIRSHCSEDKEKCKKTETKVIEGK